MHKEMCVIGMACSGIIYCITCKVNGKQYIGQTTQPLPVRWSSHVSAAFGPDHKKHILQRAIFKHGAPAFDVSRLCAFDSQPEADKLEQLAIDVNGTLTPNGYNIQAGGANGLLAGAKRRQREEDAQLPKYISSFVRGATSGYSVKYKGKYWSTGTAKLDMSTKLKMAQEVLANFEAGLPHGQVAYKRVKHNEGLPRHVYTADYGAYEVVYKKQRKKFGKASTDDENLSNAIAWLDKLMNDAALQRS